MIKYVRELEFEQDPDYNYLRELINKMFKKDGSKNDGVLDWLGHSGKTVKGKDESTSLAKNGLSKRSYFSSTKKSDAIESKSHKTEKKEDKAKDSKNKDDKDGGCVMF